MAGIGRGWVVGFILSLLKFQQGNENFFAGMLVSSFKWLVRENSL